jgi:prepilin-type N-terminal cleavage/methylation domain-containing protein
MARAFTLIELLVVVAIIAILAAIAVPNFLEAQTRSKVSRTKSDQRTMTSALEMYAVDHMKLPQSQFFNLPGAVKRNWLGQDEVTDPDLNEIRRVLERLSTPLAYITSSFMPDLFGPRSILEFKEEAPEGVIESIVGSENYYLYQYMKYAAFSSGAGSTYILFNQGRGDTFVLICAGPSRVCTSLVGPYFYDPGVPEPLVIGEIYDPTNGTVSHGSIFRVGGAVIDRTKPAGRFVAILRAAK